MTILLVLRQLAEQCRCEALQLWKYDQPQLAAAWVVVGLAAYLWLITVPRRVR